MAAQGMDAVSSGTLTMFAPVSCEQSREEPEAGGCSLDSHFYEHAPKRGVLCGSLPTEDGGGGRTEGQKYGDGRSEEEGCLLSRMSWLCELLVETP